MALVKTDGFQRITLSLPASIILKLEKNVPKNQRSKFVAKLIDSNLSHVEADVSDFKDYLRKFKDSFGLKKRTESVVDLVRADRKLH